MQQFSCYLTGNPESNGPSNNNIMHIKVGATLFLHSQFLFLSDFPSHIVPRVPFFLKKKERQRGSLFSKCPPHHLTLTSWAVALSVLGSAQAYINYTIVAGYFLQDDPATNASTFTFTTTNFGLINRTYPADASCSSAGSETQWQRFAAQVAALNAVAPANTEYKVLYMGRHGEGYHNAAESYYGTPGWNCFWAE
jgi:hypothetical protein